MTSRAGLAAVFVLLAGLALSACGRSAPPKSTPLAAPPLASMTVQPQQAHREEAWDGVVEAVTQATLAAQTNARVLELPVDVGDRVAKGDVLVRFSDVEQQSGRRSAQAAVASARAEVRDADASWKRTDEIFARGLIARAQLDSAVARRDAARANVASADAALRAAGQQTDYTVLRAPFAGVVTQRFVEVGEAVQSGPPTPQPLIALASLDALRVDVAVPQSSVAAIRKFNEAVIVTDNTRVRAASMIIFPYADPATHTFRIRVKLAGGASALYPGMTVKVAFATGAATRLLVPLSALVQRSEVSGIYVIGADHSVGLRQLRLGHRQGDEVEVLAGLAAGEQVALDPDAAALYLADLHAAKKRSP